MLEKSMKKEEIDFKIIIEIIERFLKKAKKEERKKLLEKVEEKVESKQEKEEELERELKAKEEFEEVQIKYKAFMFDESKRVYAKINAQYDAYETKDKEEVFVERVETIDYDEVIDVIQKEKININPFINHLCSNPEVMERYKYWELFSFNQVWHSYYYSISAG